MKKNHIKASLTVTALLMSTTALHAQEFSLDTGTETTSISNSGAVGVALSGDTGFLTGGQVSVAGTGQGSLVLSRGAGDITVQGSAFSAFGADEGGVDGFDTVPTTGSSMVSTFDFDRDVNSGAALVGVGQATAQGESIGGISVLGSAEGGAELSGTRVVGGDTQTGSSDSSASSQGSLVGSFSTANTIQLLGQGSLFAGSQALDIGERNAGISAGVTGFIQPGGVAFLGLSPDFDGGVGIDTTGLIGFGEDAGGALFASISDLTGADNSIEMNVANAGEGSILVTGSTGGFFSEGTNAGAAGIANLTETGGFFTNP